MSALARRLTAEFLGTFWLVLGGCGAAVLASGFKPQTNLGIGFVGVSLAFGLTVLTGAYALAAVSGGHFNPAVTLGLWLSRRIEATAVIPYVVVQVAGAIAASGVLAIIARGAPGFDLRASGFAANGYDAHSPGHYSLGAALTAEIVLTAFFVLVILGTTARTAPASFAAARDRPVAHVDSPDLDPGHQHVGEPGAFDRTRVVRRRLGAATALAVLGRAPRRRGDRRRPLSSGRTRGAAGDERGPSRRVTRCGP